MLNPHDLSHVKNFSFDRAFWPLEHLQRLSGCAQRSVKPTDPHFATQENVMEDLGSELGRHLRLAAFKSL